MMIDDLIDMDAVAAEITAGYVTERAHPEFPELRILNYTERCQFDRHWNDITRTTRGLIYNADTRRVLARPFPKFHNYGEPEVGDIDLDADIYGAWDKLDGSLGIQYTRPDGKDAIATRGSFDSEQARHGTAWLQASPWGILPPDVTWLWEIIYPENRIVVDYGTRDELVFLGSVDRENGEFDSYAFSQAGFAHAAPMNAHTFREALNLPDRAGAEGIVVWLDRYRPVKVKQADYVALHRIVSNLTVKEVWRQLRAGTFNEFVVALPDEFHTWAIDTAAPLVGAHEWKERAARAWYADLLSRGFESRKEQAMWVTAKVPADLRGFVFSLLDGKDISDGVWRVVEPKPTSERDEER